MVRALIVALALAACAGYALSQAAEQTAAEETAETAATTEAATEAAVADTIVETPESRVTALFQSRCVACHGGQKPPAGLSLEAGAFQQRLPGVASRQLKSVKLVDLETPEKSYVLMKVRGEKGIQGGRMPAGGAKLPDADVLVIQEWIAELAAAASDTTAKTEAPAEKAKENQASEQSQKP
jgi:cytochrome c5